MFRLFRSAHFALVITNTRALAKEVWKKPGIGSDTIDTKRQNNVVDWNEGTNTTRAVRNSKTSCPNQPFRVGALTAFATTQRGNGPGMRSLWGGRRPGYPMG